MAINKIPVKISLRKNQNAKSPAYGKFYPVVENEETISTRALKKPSIHDPFINVLTIND